MDDAGLGDSVQSNSQHVDNQTKDPKNTHLNPSRWWFASAAFPMIAGTIGPVASAFSICALVEKWRQVIPPGKTIKDTYFIQDPSWLIVVNAVQLVIAVISNLALLLNMTKRLRFSVAQPVTIVGWYFSAICLIVLTSTAGSILLEKEVEGELIWSKAFYYGIFAAVLYFLVASLLVVTVWGAQAGHYPKQFHLTASQRTLMLQTIVFLMYLLVGALVFSTLENWKYLDGLYWAIVTLFTIGFGDFAPKTRVGRGLFIPYALVGITSLGLVIGSIRSLVLDRGRVRLEARILERSRKQLIRRMQKKGQVGFLEPLVVVDGDALQTFPELEGVKLPRSEFERRNKEFQLMRKVQAHASKQRRWTAMTVSTTTWLVLWLVGAVIFQQCEYPYQQWTYFNGVYFTFEALTTVGYGDLSPVSNSGRAFMLLWSLLALPTTTILISNAGDTVVAFIRDGTLALGNLTILPGEFSFVDEGKRIISSLSCGLVFRAEEFSETETPDFLQRTPTHEEKDALEDIDEDSEDTDEKAQTHFDVNKPMTEWEEHQLMETSKIPSNRAEYHLLLMREITKITQQLRNPSPKEYSFREWSWYLRLVGEDESKADTHRPPDPMPTSEGKTVLHPSEQTSSRGLHGVKGAPEDIKWSWVGHRSPLMDPLDETQWILDRLQRKLQQELEADVKEQRRLFKTQRREASQARKSAGVQSND